MKKLKNTYINIAAALITFLVQIFISFWLSPFLVNQLGEEAYGFVNLANNFVSYASLVTVAVNSMACRYISVEYNSGRIDEAKKYFSSVFFVNTFLYCLIIIVSIIFVGRIEMFINVSPTLIRQVKLTFLLSFINMGTSMIGTVYTAAAFTHNKMHYSSLVQVVANVIKSIFVYLLFMLLPAKVYYLILATLLAGIVTLFGNYKVTKLLFKEFNISLKLFDFKKIVTLISSGFWVLISNISNLLLNGFDLLLSNWFISAAMMGRLSLAKQIPYAISSGLGVFANIFSSSLTKTYASNTKEGLVSEAKLQLRILTIFFTVPFAGIIAFGNDFLRLWLSDSVYTPYEVREIYFLMNIILIDIIVSAYMYSIHSLFIAIDRVKSYSIVLFVSSVISIFLTVLLLKFTSIGVYAIAGTSTLILGVAHAIIVPAMIAKMLNIPIYTFWVCEMKSWGLLAIITLGYLGIGKFFTINTWSVFFSLVLCLAILGYGVSVFIMLTKRERESFLAIIKNK